MPIRVEVEREGPSRGIPEGYPERRSLAHLRPGDEPYTLFDYTDNTEAGLVIAAVCGEDGKQGEIYHIPADQLDRFWETTNDGRIPEELLNDDNLHTTLEWSEGNYGRESYQREIITRTSVNIGRFVFTFFQEQKM